MDLSEIDDLLTRAARSNKSEDSEALFEALRGEEIFFWIKTESKIDPLNGQTKDVAVSSPLLRLSSGQRAFMVYTSLENPRLQRPCGGASWERALHMLLSMVDADGLILTNSNEDAIAVDKKNAARILGTLELSPDRSLARRSRH